MRRYIEELRESHTDVAAQTATTDAALLKSQGEVTAAAAAAARAVARGCARCAESADATETMRRHLAVVEDERTRALAALMDAQNDIDGVRTALAAAEERRDSLAADKSMMVEENMKLEHALQAGAFSRPLFS